MWLIGASLAALALLLSGVLGLLARGMPAGRGRDLVGLLPNCLVLLRRLRADKTLPLRARLVVAAALAYLVSPVQLIPNFIPLLRLFRRPGRLQPGPYATPVAVPAPTPFGPPGRAIRLPSSDS